MSGVARWNDLAPRLISAAFMVLLGGIGLWVGGIYFAIGVWILAGLMIWELARMIAPTDNSGAVRLGLLSFAALALAWVLPSLLLFPVLVSASLVGANQMPDKKGNFLIFASATLFACHAMVLLRESAGLTSILWVIVIVVTSDVMGYFAGRTLGGPKFWPAISPKKTWSGTIAGWIGAAIVGLLFGLSSGVGANLVVISILVAFAGQMGDIWESAIKRQTGIKDSSNLIPGHGGVLDRFDAMLGAALLAGLLWVLGILPGLT